MALISGLAAKEVVVSSITVLFGGVGGEALRAALGALGFGGINAYAMMLFVLLYIPCAASIATIKRESGSWRFTLGAMAMQLGTAWVVSALFYNIASVIVG